jgi:hypothetical protein
MSDLTIDVVDGMGDFLTDEVYELVFTSLYKGASVSSQQLNILARGLVIPDTPVNYMQVTHRTFTKSQPVTRTNYQTVQLSMVELKTPQSMPFLRDWQNRCAMKGTNYVYPPDERQCQILVYHKNNNKDIVYYYKIVNAQIENKGSITLSEGSSPKEIAPQVQLNAMAVLEGPDLSDLA